MGPVDRPHPFDVPAGVMPDYEDQRQDVAW
jgi:hypothetical protein